MDRDWKSIAELVGIAAIVASLVFVGIQLRQEQDIAQSQLTSDWDDTRIEWSKLLHGNSDVWLRGLAGTELDQEEQLRFESLADTWFHIENGRYNRSNRIGLAEPRGLGIRVAAFLIDHPGLRKWWIERWEYRRSMGIGIPSFVAVVDSFIEDMESDRLEHIERDSAVPM